MNMKLSGIVDYITYLVKKYGEIQQTQMKNTFRVASIKTSNTDTKIIIQVIGKSTFMECSPSEILSNDAFVERFSQKDVQKITLAYAQEQEHKKKLNPDLKLVKQVFNMLEGKTNFILQDQKGNTTSKSAAEIFLDSKTIDHLSQKDAKNISYIAGYEHSQNDSNN